MGVFLEVGVGWFLLRDRGDGIKPDMAWARSG